MKFPFQWLPVPEEPHLLNFLLFTDSSPTLLEMIRLVSGHSELLSHALLEIIPQNTHLPAHSLALAIFAVQLSHLLASIPTAHHSVPADWAQQRVIKIRYTRRRSTSHCLLHNEMFEWVIGVPYPFSHRYDL